MKFKIEKHILKKSDELAFIRIKENIELNLEGYNIPKDGLDVPIKNEVLVKGIKEGTAQDNLNLMSIADAMIYIIGIDHNFKYNEEYKKFLKALEYKINIDIESYIGYMGRQKFEEGEISDSLVYCKALITIDNNNINGLYHYALVCQEIAKNHQKNGQEKEMNEFLLEALDKLETILEIDPSFGSAFYQLGYHYYNQSQYIKAKLTWEQGLELGLDEESTMEIQEQLGKIQNKVQYEEGYNLVFQGKSEEGLKKLIPLVEEYPEWWNLLFIIGLAYKDLEDLGEAISYFEKILILKPKQVDTLMELGLCYSMIDINKTIEYFHKALDIKEDAEILCNLGMAYLNNGDVDIARDYIEKAYELNPEDEITVACMKELDNY
ncbi:MAG TPA: tetratricopeptide repeat protein [Peptostreptococcaceae bacterium]|nr:tetratricopeptide repeat protein [Peptostreptococcaceae bacterium]